MKRFSESNLTSFYINFYVCVGGGWVKMTYTLTQGKYHTQATKR